MRTYQIELTPVSCVQNIETSNSFISSLTLFGAICWGIKNLYGENSLIKIIQNFSIKPQFLLTSAFPLIRTEKIIDLRFYPNINTSELSFKKIENIATENSKSVIEIITLYKKFRKASWISEKVFKDKINPKITEGFLFQNYLKKQLILENGYLLYKNEISEINKLKLSKNLVNVRTAIDRFSNSTIGAGEIFYDFLINFNSILHLYFWFKTDDFSFYEPVFKYLSDTGIGGERTSGFNHYKITWKEIENPFPSNNESKKFITLSCYQYNKNDLDWQRSAEFSYELLFYRGKIETGFDFKNKQVVSKNKILYFKEGSVLVATRNKEYYGGLSNSLKIDKFIINNYGFAFPIFFSEVNNA